MKCDELKPLVFSISDLSFVDEPTPQPNFQNPHDHAVYKATEVEEAIAELKKKLEDVQASMYADVVDANMENRRLKRALYNLRVCYADMMQKRYIECKTDGWVHRIDKWIEVERRCLKKAEEYK